MKKPYPSSDPSLIPDTEVDSDGDASASPERLCAVTRERLPKEDMLRFVLSPDNIVTPDIAARHRSCRNAIGRRNNPRR